MFRGSILSATILGLVLSVFSVGAQGYQTIEQLGDFNGSSYSIVVIDAVYGISWSTANQTQYVMGDKIGSLVMFSDAAKQTYLLSKIDGYNNYYGKNMWVSEGYVNFPSGSLYNFKLGTNMYAIVEFKSPVLPPVLPTYKIGAFLPPLIKNSTTEFKAKAGRTVPVKFQLLDYNTNLPCQASEIVHITITKMETIDSPAQTISGDLSTGEANFGTDFRYDPMTQQYIYNLNTALLSSGATYKIGVTVGTSVIEISSGSSITLR